jgi:hypothetical protein
MARPTISAVFSVFDRDGRRSGGTPRVPKPSWGMVVPSFGVTRGLLLTVVLSFPYPLSVPVSGKGGRRVADSPPDRPRRGRTVQAP